MPQRIAPPLDTEYLSTRFWSQVDKRGPGECWPWRKSVGSHGYGQTWDGITVRLAHRCAWTLTFGPIPTDLTIDHACRTPRCCNPEHLRLMTNLDNATSNGNKVKTHCIHGHEFSPENTRLDGRGHRRCLTCARQRPR